MSDDKALLDNVVVSLRALIIAELDGTAVNRFQRAAKLCTQANQISQMHVKRVADVDRNMANPYGGINIVGEMLAEGQNEGYDAPIQMRVGRNVQADTVDLLRELITTFAPPKPVPKLEDSLGRLIDLRDLAQKAGRETVELDKQIDEMIAVETQKYLLPDKKESAHAPVSLVNTQLLRRSSLGEVGCEALPVDHRQGDGERAEGDREPVGDGAQEEVGRDCAVCHD